MRRKEGGESSSNWELKPRTLFKGGVELEDLKKSLARYSYDRRLGCSTFSFSSTTATLGYDCSSPYCVILMQRV